MDRSAPNRSWPPGSLLAGLAPATQQAFLRLGNETRHNAHQVLLREGEQSTHAFLLVDGCVKVTTTTENGAVTLVAIRVGGEIVGELGSLDEQPRSATVTSAGQLRSRAISQGALREFLIAHPDAALQMSRTIGTKLRGATRRRTDFGSYDARVRLARALVELANRYGRPRPSGLEIGVALTQPELAALVGAAEPTVHKILAGLRHQGVLDTGYRSTTVRDIEALRTLAGLTSSPGPDE